MRAFEVFPQVTHKMRGGGPSRSSKTTKSWSFVITTAPAFRAARKISSSLAPRRPRSRTQLTSTENLDAIQRASWGDS